MLSSIVGFVPIWATIFSRNICERRKGFHCWQVKLYMHDLIEPESQRVIKITESKDITATREVDVIHSKDEAADRLNFSLGS